MSRVYRFSFGREKIIVRYFSDPRDLAAGWRAIGSGESESGTPGSVSTMKQFSARIIRQASNLAPNSACLLSRADEFAVPGIETGRAWMLPELVELIFFLR